MVITSVDNKKIKKYYALKNHKGRKEWGLFLIEGEHLCEEAYKNNLLVDILIEEKEKISFNYSNEITYVTPNILKKLSNLVNYSKVIGVCKTMNYHEIKGNHLLLLDDIQDPGNLGTIIRSSKAFDVDTIILSQNSVDIYNDKVLRSSEGMIFHSNIIYDNLEDVIQKLKKEQYLILGTNVKNGIDVKNIKPKKYALIMGNEGKGVKQELLNLCDKQLYIKMNSDCESLNVSVATSILLYELRGNNE